MSKIRKSLKVSSMTCVHCEVTVEEALANIKGVKEVKASFAKGEVSFIFEEELVSIKDIKAVIKESGYEVAEKEEKDKAVEKSENLSIFIIILGGYVILKHMGITSIFNYFPQIQSSVGYGMVFFIGLLTSIHCVAMCGGINLAQSVNCINHGQSTIVPNLLYNMGRVISYTVIGGLAGALGSVVSFGSGFSGAVALLAGVFMVIMGLNMLNIFPELKKFNLRMPKFIGKKITMEKNRRTSSFYIGLLNGLMPCGPLQSMQLYALSTGSFGAGALAMFFFSLGTVPLLFGLGTLSSKLNKQFTKKMMTICSVLVIILGVGMTKNGLALWGVTIPNSSIPVTAENTAVIKGEHQEVVTNLDFDGYPAILVKAGVPVKWVINAAPGKLNGCNKEIVIPKLNKRIKLKEGENIIEFMPEESGRIGYSCWMGMIRNNIEVIK